MELVEVEIIGQAITARYGTLNTGDVLRTDAAFAKHLVEDCAAAKYSKALASEPPIAPPAEQPVIAPEAPAAQEAAEPATKPSRAKKQ